MAEIAVIGIGYVGLVSALAFAKLGHNVKCFDIDKKKIELLEKGITPIYEQGIEKILKESIKKNKIEFTSKLSKALSKANFVFIAVGTPQNAKGKAELKYYWNALKNIIKELKNQKELIIVNKSTVPVGTARKAMQFIEKKLKKVKVYVVSNPEFLREGTALYDFLKPDRIVIGADNKRIARKVALLYKKIKKPLIITSPENAELIKYASNAFLATKISFINEIALLCDKVNADIKIVAKGIGLDKRINPFFLNAGLGYGGSCFPKDVQALIHIGKENGINFKIIKETEKVNKQMKVHAIKLLKKELGKLKGKTISVLGLAFKPNTDDMREASSINLINALLKEKAKVKAFDPKAMNNAKKIFGKKIYFAKNPFDCTKNSNALILVTEWPEFKKLNLKKIRKQMNGFLLIDGRNFLEKKETEKAGFKYLGIGRK